MRPTIPDHVSPQANTQESGLGLIEIVVSVFLLALLALAFLPLVIRTYTLTGSNTTLSTGTQLVGQQIDEARAQTGDVTPALCSTLTTFAGTRTGTTSTADERGVTFKYAIAVVCPSAYPGTAKYTATVLNSVGLATVATATTLIYVSAP